MRVTQGVSGPLIGYVSGRAGSNDLHKIRWQYWASGMKISMGTAVVQWLYEESGSVRAAVCRRTQACVGTHRQNALSRGYRTFVPSPDPMVPFNGKTVGFMRCGDGKRRPERCQAGGWWTAAGSQVGIEVLFACSTLYAGIVGLYFLFVSFIGISSIVRQLVCPRKVNQELTSTSQAALNDARQARLGGASHLSDKSALPSSEDQASLHSSNTPVPASPIPYIVPLAIVYSWILFHSYEPDTVSLILPGSLADGFKDGFNPQFFPNISGISTLFSRAATAASLWIHLLCINIFAAHSILVQGFSTQTPTPHSILLAMVLGPIGLLTHSLTRAAWRMTRSPKTLRTNHLLSETDL